MFYITERNRVIHQLSFAYLLGSTYISRTGTLNISQRNVRGNNCDFSKTSKRKSFVVIHITSPLNTLRILSPCGLEHK